MILRVDTLRAKILLDLILLSNQALIEIPRQAEELQKLQMPMLNKTECFQN